MTTRPVLVDPRSRRRIRAFVGMALVLWGASAGLAAKKEDPRLATLTSEQRSWLDSVEVMITEAEREVFLALEKEYQRDAFIERFWQARDPYRDTARNELRENWDVRVQEARQAFGSLKEDRSRFFLLNGAPAARLRSECTGVLWPLEVWVYPESDRLPEVLVLIFVQRAGLGPYRIWHPGEGVSTLMQFARAGANDSALIGQLANECVRSDQIVAAIASVTRRSKMDYDLMVARAEQRIEAPSREWVATFNSYSTDLPEDLVPLPGELSIGYPARRQSRSVLQGTVGLAITELTPAEYGGVKSYNFQLNGEVLLGRKLFDVFRYKFDFAASQVESASVPLVFERYLRPGDYTLIVRVEDLNSKRVYREERKIVVPAVEGEMPPPDPDDATSRLLAEANAALTTGETTLRLIRPTGEIQAGLVRFDTLATGDTIDAVQFTLDGRPILRKNRPPYSVELDLGEVPGTRTLAATGFDVAGEEVARDEMQVNASAHRFRARLIEPRPGKKYDKSLRAEAEIDLPEDASVERVELFLNETRVATLYQPPYTQAILLPAGETIAYVRAVAYLADGNSTEDLVFVNAPENLEEIEIQFVELYTSVLDRDKRPVQNLGREAFSVEEDGASQEITRFERLDTLPMHVAIVLDVSASMELNLETARQAALKFFEEKIHPRDRAALVTFNDRPRLAVKMTNQVGDLAAGLAGLKAERGTSLYDTVVFTLFYFNGIKGQRAMLLLSDGKDENSRFTIEKTLDFARRAGVAIYPIGLDIKRGESETRGALKDLAAETGGRSFFIDEVADLARIYDEVEKELRSRYLIAYQSTNSSRDLKFRTVEVDVEGSGLEVKTIRGYYP